MGTTSTSSGLTVVTARRARLRLFAASDADQRSRRASDLIRVVASIAALAFLGLVAIPSSGLETSVERVAEAMPTALDGLWRLLSRWLVAAAVVVVAAALFRRLPSVVRDQVLAALTAIGIGLVMGRLVSGSWVYVWRGETSSAGQSWAPWASLAAPVAVLAVTGPHMTRFARRAARWSVWLGSAAVLFLGTTAPTRAAVGLVAGLGAASLVHLVLGSTQGRPRVEDVREVLAAMGVDVTSIRAASRQRAGVYVLEAVHVDGRILDVKVYGGDAADTQFVSALWRTIWYRDFGASVWPGRRQQVTHEALLTLLAAQGGVTTQPVVTVGVTANDDAVLVLERIGSPLSEAGEWDADLVRAMWAVLDRLHGAGVVHRQVDEAHLVEVADGLALVDFRGGAIESEAWRARVDLAQALVTSALAVGIDDAVALAVECLGQDRVAAVLPFLQSDACTPAQRRALKAEDLDIDELRDRASGLVGVDAPELQRLRRVTWASVIQVGLPILGFVALASVVAGIDLAEVGAALEDASWWFVGAGFVIGQFPGLSRAVSAMGAAPVPIPLSRLLVLQFAQGYIALTIPTAAARVAMNVRFFQRHGLGAVSAVTVGALDSFFGFIGQVIVLTLVLTMSSATLDLDVGAPSSGLVVAVAVIAALAVLAVGVAFGVPRFRRAIVGRVRTLWREASSALAGLGSARRLGLLLGGNIGTEVFSAMALGALVIALGYHVPLPQLMLIHVAVSLFAGIMPIPGGVGVVEGGLTFGLVTAGVPDEAAFAAALLFRTFTFYLPPVWGYFAFRWLERNKYL
jgi:uncharacterized membrane protein YbhN (UPF0104 family)